MRNYYHDLGKYPPITVPGMLRGRVGLTVYSFGFRVRIFGASEVEYYGGDVSSSVISFLGMSYYEFIPAKEWLRDSVSESAFLA